MEPIILERPDVRELAGELIKCGICTGSNLTQQIYDAWALWAAPIKYISSVTDTAYICPSRIAFRAGDYVATRQGFYFGMVQNSIDALVHEMYENCSVRPVCYSENDEFELREIEEMHAACEYIKNSDYEFVRDRAYELGIDAAHLHFDNEGQLVLTINGSDSYFVKFRVMYGNVIMGEIK
jgi:hypothetical protein